MTQDKTHLRTTFDQDALLYDQARPAYPEALFDDIVTLAYQVRTGCWRITWPRQARHISPLHPRILQRLPFNWYQISPRWAHP